MEAEEKFRRKHCHVDEVSDLSSNIRELPWVKQNNKKQKGKKGHDVVNYNHYHGSTSLKKHVDTVDTKYYNQYVNEMAKKQALETLTITRKKKEKEVHQALQIVDFFESKEAQKKLDLPHMNFLQNLMLLIAKGCIQLSLVESQYIQRLVVMCELKINFPSKKQLIKEHIPAMFMKTMEHSPLPSVGKSTIVSITFDLWMRHGTHDTLCMVVTFQDMGWMPRRVTFGVF